VTVLRVSLHASALPGPTGGAGPKEWIFGMYRPVEGGGCRGGRRGGAGVREEGRNEELDAAVAEVRVHHLRVHPPLHEPVGESGAEAMR